MYSCTSNADNELTITGLTTLCTIVVLHENDYIDINGKEYYLNKSYTNLNSTSHSSLLTDLLKECKIIVSVDHSNRLNFRKEYDAQFFIYGMSYNMKQITGMYNTPFPIRVDTKGGYSVQSVGFYLSTPILYLISNLGARCFQSKARNLSDQKVVMRINNSFMTNLPIISNNVEFTTLAVSNSLSDIVFKLVDANFRPIKLLSPIFISAIGEDIETSYHPWTINMPGSETLEAKQETYDKNCFKTK